MKDNLFTSIWWGLMTALILGSYGYTSWSTTQINSRISNDLARIEVKVDEINRYLRDKK